jgi:hypothetical protein
MVIIDHFFVIDNRLKKLNTAILKNLVFYSVFLKLYKVKSLNGINYQIFYLT